MMENGTLIISSTENAKFVILATGENSSCSVRSDLGDEIPNSYKVISGVGHSSRMNWVELHVSCL